MKAFRVILIHPVRAESGGSLLILQIFSGTVCKVHKHNKSCEQLDKAQTADPFWNAFRLKIVHYGKMHGGGVAIEQKNRNDKKHDINNISPQADTMTTDWNNVLATIENKDTYQPPYCLEKLEGRTHVFQFHFDTGTTSKRPAIILNAVLDSNPMALLPPSLNPTTPTHTLVPRYLAHEFLTKGTISENLYDPTQAKFPPTPLACIDSVDKGNGKCVELVKLLSLEPSNGNVNRGKEKIFELSLKPKLSEIIPQLVMEERYVEVSRELKNGMYY
ncbi:hypothetical protein Tco_1284452 [Tanacetum coccineum]